MPKALVTGACGFIGCNTVRTLRNLGWDVVGVDNLSRKGSDLNKAWLEEQGFSRLVEIDITDRAATDALLKEHHDADVLVHLAGQVAVTSSVADPTHDFENNLTATFNLLEGCRASAPSIHFLFASTNKVYGGLESHPFERQGDRYILPAFPQGIDEGVPLDFHSPYGCSKGAADQYVRDYARIYGLKTTVFRQSCIYGQRQLGVEDQGWLAWFLIAAEFGKPITLYGDGLQVRDLLHVDDLIALYLRAIERGEQAAGAVYNVGGGMNQSKSLREFLDLVQGDLGITVKSSYSEWRPGDQRFFVADIGKVSRELGWSPQISVRDGVERLAQWIRDNRTTIQAALSIRDER